ncbi:MAG: hypothetical protein RJQ04_14755 [Longimicrobiales bacterium]
MPFRRDGSWVVNLVVVLLLVGVAGPALFPEQRWMAWGWWIAVGIGGVYLLTVLVDSGRAAKEARETRRLLDRLAALRNERDDPEAVAAEADDLLRRLGERFVQMPDLVATDGLVEAAATPGPHRVACLRLIMRRAFLWGEPWIQVLADGRGALEGAHLDADERERLEQLDRFLVNRARQEDGEDIPGDRPPE